MTAIEMTTIEVSELTSPLGAMVMAVRAGRLCALCFSEHWPQRRRHLENRFRPVVFRTAPDAIGLQERLRAYFDGDSDALTGVVAEPSGTDFQQRVWRVLRAIAPGQTLSYGEVAQRIGTPTACRAVGAANGANPIAIVIPCHRVIGADGTLTGYGGGLERKRWLLEHERRSLGTERSRAAGRA